MKVIHMKVTLIENEDDIKEYQRQHDGGLTLDIGGVAIKSWSDQNRDPEQSYELKAFDNIRAIENGEIVYQASGVKRSLEYVSNSVFNELTVDQTPTTPTDDELKKTIKAVKDITGKVKSEKAKAKKAKSKK